ncbi:hypothetical protein BC830DRAFT_116173 [Chytriomyces sp. MP71]|nr:hypothetical protein BC830DRAFT_116173 [Chytriomyces sp. MP71]
MSATKETVFEHLRALGYEGDGMSNFLSESFIADCVTELNAMSYSGVSDYHASSVSQTSQQRHRADRAANAAEEAGRLSPHEVEAVEVAGTAGGRGIRETLDEHSHDSDALFVQQLLKEFGDNLDSFKDVEHEDSPAGLSRHEWVTGTDPISIGEEVTIPSPSYSHSRSKYPSFASSLIPDPYSFSQRDEGYELELLAEREMWAESNQTCSVPSQDGRKTSRPYSEMTPILQEYQQKQHLYGQENGKNRKDSNSESDPLSEEYHSATSSQSESPEPRNRTPTAPTSSKSYLADPQHSLSNPADTSMSVIERLAKLDLARLHTIIREQKLEDARLKAGLSMRTGAGTKSTTARSIHSASAPTQYPKQPALSKDQHPYRHKLVRNIAKPVIKYTPPMPSTPPLLKATRAALRAIDAVNEGNAGSSAHPEVPLLRSTSGFIKTNRPPAPRKADPVARFHAHQRVWKNDDFLARRQSKPKPTHSSAPSTTVGGRQRHNLAAMRPTYGEYFIQAFHWQEGKF